MKLRYYIKESYPFAKYSKNTLVFPTKKEILEFKKYPQIFEDKTIAYKIINRNNKGEIIKVKCLKNKKVFEVGNEVIYTANHLDYYCAFIISGFKELNDGFNDFIYVCFNSTKYNDTLARACGLGKIELLEDKTIYNKIEYLK